MAKVMKVQRAWLITAPPALCRAVESDGRS
jgi:hypothetical protein